MANQDSVAITIAKGIVDNSGKLLNAIDDLQELYRWASDAGINFNDFAELLSSERGNGDTQHTEPLFLNRAAATVIPALSTWLGEQSVTDNGTQYSYRQILQHNRRG